MKKYLSKFREGGGDKHKIGIKSRLFLGFDSVVGVFVLSAVISIYVLNSAQNETNEFITQAMPAQNAMITISSEVNSVELNMQSLIFFHDDSVIEKIKNSFTNTDAIIRNYTPVILKLNDAGITGQWNDLGIVLHDYKNAVNELIAMISAGNTKNVMNSYRDKLIPITKRVNEGISIDVSNVQTMKGVIYSTNQFIVNKMKTISHEMRIIVVLTTMFVIFSIILSYIIAVFTSKSILNPIHYAIDIARNIAKGNRDMDIEIRSGDETGELLKSLLHMRDAIKEGESRINEILMKNKRLYDSLVKAANLFGHHAGRVSAGCLTERLDVRGNGIDQEVMIKLGNELNSMTDNLANINQDIMHACKSMVTTIEEMKYAVDAQSSGAGEQASSINQITASISEIEKSAVQTMAKAKQLGAIAERTRLNGQHGLESIENSLNGMKLVRERVQMISRAILDLSRQTKQVDEITSVVNAMAQQSKMLALNASIEAAKAGDAGKGFAVVAAEVKSLAEQSEQSTLQVKKILEDIRISTDKAVMVTEDGVHGVDDGVQMIEKTGDVIRSLNDVIREASIASQQIEAAVRQESSGVEQITVAMNEINSVTASFVSGAHRTTEAMNNLHEVMLKLKSNVDQYKI